MFKRRSRKRRLRRRLKEILLHVTAYCGIPAGLDAFKAARQVLEDEGRLRAK
jgi:4-carboxymuconolactone decarboxylase